MHGSATEIFTDILERAEAAHQAEERALREPILVGRETTHGDYTVTARIAQTLKEVMRSQPGWEGLTDIMRESLEINATKTARILAGNPLEKDHWDDIAGYAKLVSERI